MARYPTRGGGFEWSSLGGRPGLSPQNGGMHAYNSPLIKRLKPMATFDFTGKRVSGDPSDDVHGTGAV